MESLTSSDSHLEMTRYEAQIVYSKMKVICEDVQALLRMSRKMEDFFNLEVEHQYQIFGRFDS